MNIALWTVAGLLALAFVAGGLLKVVMSRQRIRATGGASAAWTDDVSPARIKTIGVLEILGGLGLVLPGVTGIAPELVPLAALGLAMIMVGAAVTRISRREYRLLVPDLAYLVLIAFVLWGRLGPVPLAA